MAVQTYQNQTLGDRLRWGKEEVGEVRGELSQIVSELAHLLESEKRLAKAEVQEQVSLATRTAAFGFGALKMAMLFAVFLFLGIMFALDTELPLWASALVTALILAGLTAVLGYLAYSNARRVTFLPKRFFTSLREDWAWAKNQLM